ncbi:DUF554 domain-containing protein [Salinicoccus sp. RF5]|nr:DUF554 domain-containing protein [Salinicoccus sp. RF5]MCC4723295.1 DUF554 domain-containing protein [Salinicoccus sp. RF5]
MSLLGTAVNALAIIAGSFIGLFWRNINEDMKTTIIQGLSITVLVLGIDMALESNRIIIVVVSIALGAMLGERWRIEERMNRFGIWLETKTGAKEDGVAAAFVTATLVYVVGAVGIVGALDSGLRGDHTVLFTKSLIDGIMSIFLTSALGIGIIFSAFPVFLFQGSITIFAAQIDRFIPPELMDQFIIEITGAGGVMIIAIGLRLLGILNIRVANLLPAIPIIMLIVAVLYYWTPAI